MAGTGASPPTRRGWLSFGDSCRLRGWYCTGIALAYVAAFASLHAQYPGLYGHDGLQPADAFLQRVGSRIGQSAGVENRFQALPTVAWFAPGLGVSTDVVMEAVCVLGVALGTLGALQFHNPIVFGLLWLLYLSCYCIGQTFLSFQWDILLLEVGFATIFYAPLMPENKEPPPEPALWLLRVIFFKLMLMAGLVKLQAKCKTWEGLTALDYHYATQCIPGPGAWYAHQLPPVVQQLAVAATLVIEIPSTLFIIAPFRLWRVAAAVVQILLQLLIIATGNYNFFNFLAAVLCLPLLADEVRDGETKPDATTASPGTFDIQGPVLWGARTMRRLATSFWGKVCLALGGVAFHAWSCWVMFSVDVAEAVDEEDSLLHRLRFKLSFEWEELEQLVAAWLPTVLAYLGVCMTGAAMLYVQRQAAYKSPRSKIVTAVSRTVRITWALAMVCAIGAVFLVVITPFKHTVSSVGNSLPPIAHQLHDRSYPWHISSSYGLFRRMTGVGPDATDRRGRHVSVTARPELIVEGTADGVEWHEIEFRYKPGDVNRALPLVAPHQPRLDWQMWFAALGSYQHAPWFVHLCDKLLEGSPDVVALLDDSYPFWHAGVPPPADNQPDTSRRLARVRATLVTYDFTRWNTSWARPQPDPLLLPSGGDADKRRQVWQRRNDGRKYLPAIGRRDKSVGKFLQHHGWSRVSHKERKEEARQRAACKWDWVAQARGRQDEDEGGASTSDAATTSDSLDQLGKVACHLANWGREHESLVWFGPAYLVAAVWALRLLVGLVTGSASEVPAQATQTASTGYGGQAPPPETVDDEDGDDDDNTHTAMAADAAGEGAASEAAPRSSAQVADATGATGAAPTSLRRRRNATRE